MLTSNRSVSDQQQPFDMLCAPVQRWIRRQGWAELREIQNLSIPAVLRGGDVIIAAATASGKTEAAFLPLISRLLQSPSAVGYRALYLGPLKALINDQHRRLESLCEAVNLPLHKWHGDVQQSRKERARKNPDGLLLVTPESLEAMLVNRGSEASRTFGGLEAIVIDELHAFIGTERGLQLSSLMSRLERAAGRRIDRIGLSATLGDMKLASQALRPGEPDGPRKIEVKGKQASSIDQHIAAYKVEMPDKPKREERKELELAVDRSIAHDLFERFRGTPNLIFVNSRAAAEQFSYLLREMSEEKHVRNEFLPHHGKLSKELREFAEVEITEGKKPATLVATSTLEMGVDIGSVEAVAQIGPPNSIASLRQRVGRSGRRAGQKPTLRLYVREKERQGQAPLSELLYFRLVQSIAVVNLMGRDFCEPPTPGGLHLSTLAHQVLALICQHGGRSALSLFQELCLEGPFRAVTPSMFQTLLRYMASPDRALIEQKADGVLLLGRKGEKRVEHFSFYAVFMTPEEFRIVADRTTLGTIIPAPQDLIIGAPISMGGRRWDVAEVNLDAKTLRVVPSHRDKAQKSFGELCIHEEIAKEMRRIYTCDDAYPFVDDIGNGLLANARFAFKAAGLEADPVQPSGKGFDLYPWTGSKQLEALRIALIHRGLEVQASWPILHVDRLDYATLLAELKNLASAPPPNYDELSGTVDGNNLLFEKFDFAVPPELRELTYLIEKTDLEAVPRLARALAVN